MNEEIKARIDTTDLSEGEHTVYIHAMERNNEWGKFTLVNFSIDTGIRSGKKPLMPGLSIVYIMIVLVSAYLILYRRRGK